VINFSSHFILTCLGLPEIDSSRLIPSHFFKTVQELYDQHKRYDDVIALADRVLSNQDYLDSTIENNIRYYLCLSLARQRDRQSNDRFLNEVQKIHGYEHNFLLGFYYRLQGRPEDALKRQHLAFEANRKSTGTRRELVQVLLILEEYSEALDLARENYELYPNNPFHIQAYFRCLMYSGCLNNEVEFINTFKKLLHDLSNIKSNKAREMYGNLESQFLALCGDKTNSFNLINDTIAQFPDSIYLIFAKFEISTKFNDLNEMKAAIDSLECVIKDDSYFYNALIRDKSIYLARSGKSKEAMRLLNSHQSFSESYKSKVIQKFQA
jgi:tetratricopeptide (TPR) repeat protein